MHIRLHPFLTILYLFLISLLPFTPSPLYSPSIYFITFLSHLPSYLIQSHSLLIPSQSFLLVLRFYILHLLPHFSPHPCFLLPFKTPLHFSNFTNDCFVSGYPAGLQTCDILFPVVLILSTPSSDAHYLLPTRNTRTQRTQINCNCSSLSAAYNIALATRQS